MVAAVIDSQRLAYFEQLFKTLRHFVLFIGAVVGVSIGIIRLGNLTASSTSKSNAGEGSLPLSIKVTTPAGSASLDFSPPPRSIPTQETQVVVTAEAPTSGNPSEHGGTQPAGSATGMTPTGFADTPRRDSARERPTLAAAMQPSHAGTVGMSRISQERPQRSSQSQPRVTQYSEAPLSPKVATRDVARSEPYPFHLARTGTPAAPTGYFKVDNATNRRTQITRAEFDRLSRLGAYPSPFALDP